MKKKTANREITPHFTYSLKNTQEWFGSIITQPLEENYKIQTRSPHGLLIAEEAARYIIPSPTLKPHQRMQIYNQQYWWRLMNTLQDNFPLVSRLFGLHAFNEKIAVPYLLRYPPNHWSLSFLGERLPSWINEFYHDQDRTLIYNAVCLDWAFSASFTSAQHPPLDLSHLIKESPDQLLSYIFYLQPSIHLFSWEYNLFAFRDSLLKENVEFWMDNPFPDLAKEKTYHFILYRNIKNRIAWRAISEGEMIFLSCFKSGSSIEAACEQLENQNESIYEEIETNLQKWIQEWTQVGWLTQFH